MTFQHQRCFTLSRQALQPRGNYCCGLVIAPKVVPARTTLKLALKLCVSHPRSWILTDLCIRLMSSFGICSPNELIPRNKAHSENNSYNFHSPLGIVGRHYEVDCPT